MKDGSFVQLQTSEQTFFNVLILRKSMFYSIDYRSRGYSRRHTHDRELMGSNPNVRYYKGFCICCYCCCEANKKYHKGWVSIIDSDSEQKEKSRDGFEPRLQSQGMDSNHDCKVKNRHSCHLTDLFLLSLLKLPLAI